LTNFFQSIGLVRTSTPIIFSKFVQPAPINRRYILGGNVNATVAGFGAFDPSIDLNRNPPSELFPSEVLRYINTRIITHNDCSFRAGMYNMANIGGNINPIIHPTSHICTLNTGNSGTCVGDSGSMLISNGMIVGVVVSGVRPCAQSANAPDIFARVSSYANWIDSYINDLN
jgi:secreted trypsin-like serine protease